jgi:hypothetical protein
MLMMVSSRLHKNVIYCRNENVLDFSYTVDSDVIISTKVNEGENGTSDSEVRLTVVNGNWYEVTPFGLWTKQEYTSSKY